MRSRRRAAVEVVLQAIIVGLLIWHTAYWHVSGEHTRMFEEAEMGKQILTAVYNLGLVLATGLSIGLLMLRVTELLGYRVGEIEHFGDEGGRPSEETDER